MAEEEMVESREFTCPTCGSHAFGTSGDTGHCHGYHQAGRLERHQTTRPMPCTFSWPRTPEEDAKVFKGTGHFSPKYQTAVAPSRPGT